MKAIGEATQEELAQVKGMTGETAHALYAVLHPEDEPRA
jgi:excinuclease UvrABC nuclease subunit